MQKHNFLAHFIVRACEGEGRRALRKISMALFAFEDRSGTAAVFVCFNVTDRLDNCLRQLYKNIARILFIYT